MRIKRFVSATVVLCVLAFNHTSHSQENVPGFNLPAAEAQRAPSLREKYLELIKAKAELMDEASLAAEIRTAEKNINELRAMQQLNEAQQLLLAITADYPDSEAATKTTRMLDAAESVGAQSEFVDDIGPALNATAEPPITRSSFQRELPRLENELNSPRLEKVGEAANTRPARNVDFPPPPNRR